MFYSPVQAFSGLIDLACSVFWILLLVTVVLFAIKMFSVNKYAEETVVERWSALLPEQAQRAGDFLSRVEAAMKSSRLPFRLRREQIPVSLTAQQRYEFVICEMDADYSAFVSCVPTGKDLQVSWLVQDHTIRGIYRVPVVGPLLLSVTKRYTFANGNRIRAFASATYGHAVTIAEELLDEARTDKSRLNRKTSGRLGPL